MCRWQWILPLGENGKGKGTRAFMHRLKKGCVVHDASYWCPIELKGSEKETLEILQSIVFNCSKDLKSIFHQKKKITLLKEYKCSMSDKRDHPQGVLGPASLIFIRDENEEDCDLKTILWVHCAYWKSCFGHIKTFASEQGINCRIGELGRIELRGPKSLTVIRKFLSFALKYGECKMEDMKCIGNIRNKEVVLYNRAKGKSQLLEADSTNRDLVSGVNQNWPCTVTLIKRAVMAKLNHYKNKELGGIDDSWVELMCTRYHDGKLSFFSIGRVDSLTISKNMAI